MAADTREPLRNYQIPDEANKINEDFPRLALALTAVGVDVDALFTSVAGKAALSHVHAIANVTGLQSALDGKASSSHVHAFDDLTDVAVSGAANGQTILRVGGQWQPWTIQGLDASVIASGTIDVARIPVLPSQVPVVSSGDLTALTSPQLASIVSGTVVTLTDGNRYVYSGSGSKTSTASYIQLADITPDWSVIANRPSTFVPSAHSHAIADTTGLQAALDGKAALSHVHAIANVTGLQSALDGKAALSHSHAIADTTGLQTALDGKVSQAGIGTAFATLAYNAVGQYGFMTSGVSSYNAGDTAPGSYLGYSNSAANSSGTPSGTWRVHGYLNVGTATLCQRVA